jgi:hypothetical protein
MRQEDWNSEKPSLVILSTMAVLDDEEKMLLMVDQVESTMLRRDLKPSSPCSSAAGSALYYERSSRVSSSIVFLLKSFINLSKATRSK